MFTFEIHLRGSNPALTARGYQYVVPTSFLRPRFVNSWRFYLLPDWIRNLATLIWFLSVICSVQLAFVLQILPRIITPATVLILHR